jgi:hypothetical protein
MFLVVYDTLNANMLGNSFYNAAISVPLPAPEGPTITKGLKGTSKKF